MLNYSSVHSELLPGSLYLTTMHLSASNTNPVVDNHDQLPVSVTQWIHCEQALLPDGWAEQVLIGIDSGGTIQDVRCDVATDYPDSAVQYLSGCLLPGMPNLHSHAHQRAMAGLAEQAGPGGDSFWTWREVMYRYAQRLQPRQLQAVAAQAYLEMLEAGYTAVTEFQYLHHDPAGKPYAQRAEMSLRVLAAARETGIGITVLPVLYRYAGFGGQKAGPGQQRFINNSDEYLEIYQQLKSQLQRGGNEAVGIAPHSLRAVSAELLTEVLQGGTGQTLRPIHIHIAEQQGEVEDCLAWSGQRPVAWLLEHFDVDASWCLVHATHLLDHECTALARSGAVAGLCPTTEANLGDGLFPMRSHLQAGGQFGIGSDSHISISPVEELRWLEYGQRLQGQCRNALVSAEQHSGRFLYEAALQGGAQASGRALGRIAPGCRADFVVLDCQHPVLFGRHRDALLDSWIFSGNNSPVRDVFVAGRQLVQSGHHINSEQITRQYRTTINELLAADTV